MDSDPDYERRFGGIRRLYGDAGADRVRNAHACVVGLGGVGSWAAEALARSGIGRLTLIDLDHVAESNINRQIQAVDASLGQAKVLAMAARIASFNPSCSVDVLEEFIDPENVAHLLPACDAIVDAIDQVRAKCALLGRCREIGQAVIATGAAGGRRDPTRIEIADLARTVQDPLAASVRARLRREHGFPRDTKLKFGIDCVYSREPVQRPGASAICDTDTEAPQGLSCAGYGSVVTVTASFGFAAAAWVLARVGTV
jgi:tRNA A37 threonylcarbamoyladenosine dehydratase